MKLKKKSYMCGKKIVISTELRPTRLFSIIVPIYMAKYWQFLKLQSLDTDSELCIAVT